MENYVALYVNDDSLDFDEGYNGTITNALIIQSETNGNRCIEADGIGSYSSKTDAFITDMHLWPRDELAHIDRFFPAERAA